MIESTIITQLRGIITFFSSYFRIWRSHFFMRDYFFFYSGLIDPPLQDAFFIRALEPIRVVSFRVNGWADHLRNENENRLVSREDKTVSFSE
jgi:hypothetical protein